MATQEEVQRILGVLQELHQEYATKLSEIAKGMLDLSNASIGKDQANLEAVLHRVKCSIPSNPSHSSTEEEILDLRETVEALQYEALVHKSTHHCMKRVCVIYNIERINFNKMKET